MRFFGVFVAGSMATLALAAPEPQIKEMRQGMCPLTCYVDD
jgi:hypothetical protein